MPISIAESKAIAQPTSQATLKPKAGQNMRVAGAVAVGAEGPKDGQKSKLLPHTQGFRCFELLEAKK
jgi:hypothetical protein